MARAPKEKLREGDEVNPITVPTPDLQHPSPTKIKKVLEGNGDGTFAPSKTTTLAAGQVPSALAVGDLDNNGVPDLVAILSGVAASPQILVLLGQKDGTFKPQAGGPVALTKSSAPTAVAVATADSQTKPYVVVCGTTGGMGTIDVLQNNGAGVLSSLTNKGIGGTGASHLVLADV